MPETGPEAGVSGTEPLGRMTLTVDMTIRLCVESDLPALEWMGLFAPHRGVIREAFDAQQRGDGLMVLGIAGGFPIGQVWIDLARKRAEGVAVLWAVRTFHPLHGTGIGRHLMRVAERLLRERGIARAELGVERGNATARRFYERLGWRVTGTLHETFRFVTPEGRTAEEPMDQWLMAKELVSAAPAASAPAASAPTVSAPTVSGPTVSVCRARTRARL